MAISPTSADSGALTVRSPRVNVFAKPAALQGEENPAARGPRGVFDAAAACASGEEVTDRFAAPSEHRGGGLGGAALLRRAVYVAALAAAAASLTFAISTHTRGDRAANVPVAVVRQPRPSRVRREPDQRTSRPHVAERRKRRKRVRRHRLDERMPRPTPRDAAPVRPAPAAPRLPSPRPGPRVPAPARPLPTRVAPGAPPEFL
jgi:hypothetical protein